MSLQACPKCGGTGGWWANCRAYGYAQQYGEWEAGSREKYETSIDNVNWRDTKYVVCHDCRKSVLRSLMTGGST